MASLGWLMMLPGVLLLTGEYLCVEVAWQCFNYSSVVTTVGTLLVGVGLIAAMLGVDDV
jgi:hypothetical protein